MRGLVGTEPRTLACVMAKTKRVMIGAKIVERLVALPGMWDGLAAWRRGILKAAVPCSALASGKVREWVMDNAPLDAVLLVIGLGGCVITAYVVLAVSYAQYRRKKPLSVVATETFLPIIEEATENLRTEQNRLENIRADARRELGEMAREAEERQEAFVEKHKIRFTEDDFEGE